MGAVDDIEGLCCMPSDSDCSKLDSPWLYRDKNAE